jgi:type II secretory pathway predicted ATPase ExeA
MDLVSMFLLYALILSVALLLVSWKHVRKLFSKEAPQETDDGLTLKAMVGDGPKKTISKTTPARQPARSWASKPLVTMVVSKPKPKVVEIAAPIVAEQSATRIDANSINKPVKVEESPVSPTSDNGSSNGSKLARDAIVEKVAEIERNVPFNVTDDRSEKANESPASEFPVQEPSEVEQVAVPILTSDAATEPSESPVEEAFAIKEPTAHVLVEDSVTQPKKPIPQEAAKIEDLASANAADTKAMQVTEPAIQEAAKVEGAVPADAMEGDMAPASEPPVQKAVRDGMPSPTLPAASGAERPAQTFLSFYGLSEQPFGVTPDPAYLYLSHAHQEAFGALSEGIRNLRGFMALIADSGMGKTTLLNKLMEDERDTARIVFLFQTQCNSRELLRYILGELGVSHAGMDLVAMHRALNEFLFQGLFEGRRFVLVVDEAQNLQDSTLETIRLLSDFETTHTKLLQIVLAGQPQLADKLMRSNLSQLRQRIAVVANLDAMDAAETARYIEHRLQVAGSSKPIFTAAALALIAERSQGIPRSINNICCNALQMACAQGCQTIDVDIVQKVAVKLDLESLVPKRPEQPKVQINPAPQAVAKNATQPPSSTQIASAAGAIQEAQKQVQGALTGKLTELARSRPWSRDQEFKLQLLLERQPSSELSVADRYYSCSFYVSEDQAAAFRLGQPVRIRFEQD